MQVFDKQGNSLLGPLSLSSVFPGSESDGDPIVLYDKFADRWMISQFQVSQKQILIAVSISPDPTDECIITLLLLISFQIIQNILFGKMGIT